VTDRNSGGARFFEEARRRSLGAEPLEGPWVRAFRKTVWRRLPRPLRQAAMQTLLGLNRRPVATGASAAAPVSVAGLLSTPTGIGEGARLCGRALAELGYDVLNVDLSDLLQGRRATSARPPLLERGPGTLILHFNPDNLRAILTLLGRRRLRGKRIIGYWAWELARIPDSWLPALAEVDEVWTPSRFVAGAVRPFTDKPVRVVLHPAAQGTVGRARRETFGTAGVFAALVMFNFASSFPRKNPVAAVHAFRRAFGDSADRLLIIKVSDADESPAEMEELRAAIGNAPNIRIEERRLGDEERLDLIASVDVLLSLHRSEGFGLVLAEAMLAGVPVIATAWSGNLDFMDEGSALLVPCQMVPASDRRGVYDSSEFWADPDVEGAAEKLAALAGDRAAAATLAAAARETAERRLGVEAFGASVAEALGPARERLGPPVVAGTWAAKPRLAGA
jgi:glycosyltransferase involved in cell wall biosynthesis